MAKVIDTAAIQPAESVRPGRILRHFHRERLVSSGGTESRLTKLAVTQLRHLYAPDAMDRPDKLADLDERFGVE